MVQVDKVAVLLTCYNRKVTTLACLRKLFEQKKPPNFVFDVYLVDDASSDGTGVAVKEAFPEVNVIAGSGNLFWAGGMRLAWSVAALKDYDAYIWLNDDVLLDADALEQLVDDWRTIREKNMTPGTIIGTFRDRVGVDHISYGVETNKGVRCLPNGAPQTFDGPMTGNFVLVPRVIFEKIGGLCEAFTHGIADYDYAYCVREAGFATYVMSKIIGTCAANLKYIENVEKIKRLSLRERIRFFYSPKGGALREFLIYRKRHWGRGRAILSWCKSWAKILLPRIFT